MAKFYGEVGYGESVEVDDQPGVYEDIITQFYYYGDVIKNARTVADGEGLNSDILVQNSISIVADQWANEHFHQIRYVKWAGTYWTVTKVEVKRPRLILTLGGVYNGPTV